MLALVAVNSHTGDEIQERLEAAAEFQKILNHRNIVGADPIGALAHLQLGRVFALVRQAKAKAAYVD
jgi:hypothetical protein